jgi:hypothetical protein
VNKESIEQAERIEKKFRHIPLIVVFMMMIVFFAFKKFGFPIFSPIDMVLIGIVIIMFFNQITLRLQMKSLLRTLKNSN